MEKKNYIYFFIILINLILIFFTIKSVKNSAKSVINKNNGEEISTSINVGNDDYIDENSANIFEYIKITGINDLLNCIKMIIGVNLTIIGFVILRKKNNI